MKIILVLALFLFCCSANNIHAQPAGQKEKVTIVNPGSRAVMLLDNYFNENVTKEILKQISPARLEDVKKYCNEANYPECFQALIDADEEDMLFGSLTVYRIAKFDNVRNGENFGEQSILFVPTDENKELNGSKCIFEEGFYIIIYSGDIETADE